MSRALRRRYGLAAAKRPAPTKGKRVSLAPSNANIHALLFPLDWAKRDAVLWAASQGYKTADVDQTASYIRIFQDRPKGKAAKAATIPFGPGGIRAVLEWR